MSLDSGYPSDSFEAYLEFIAKYGKTNLSESEFQKRFQVFRENYKFVTEHNALEDNEGIELAINQYSDMSEEAFIAKNTGLIISEERAQKMKDFKFGRVEVS